MPATGTAPVTARATRDARARASARARSTPVSPARLVGALVAATFLVSFGALHHGLFTRSPLLDTPLYERYGDLIVHSGKLPYRDFAVEYPPGALPVFAAPSLVARAGDFERYREGFEVLMLLCGTAAALLAGLVLVRRRVPTRHLVAGTLLAGLAPLALGPVVLSRFDLWPAALTAAALAAVVTGRSRLGLALLGAAVAAKLYPAVLVPLAVTHVWRERGRREALLAASAGGAVVAACFAPFVALAPHGVWASLHGQATRPLQIESLGASLLLGAHQAFGYGLSQAASHGSDNLVGALPARVASAQGLAAAGVLVTLWIAYARGPADRDRLLRYAAAAVCAFVALGRVFSPQYLMWLVPLVPLVRGRRGQVASGLFLAAMVLTQLWFPYRYLRLVYGLDPRASWLVLARDLALVLLLGVLAWPERRRRLGAALAAPLLAGAAAAAGAAALAAASAVAPSHAGVLELTGAAASCDRPSPAPAATDGSAPYAVTAFRNAGRRPACVRVRLAARGGAQLFSAAYATRFDPASPRAGYRGDAGTCTNLAGAATVSYSFRVPAGARFEVEVEPCGASTQVPRYALSVDGGGAVVSAGGRASAARSRPAADRPS
jgi:hypothetical protein